MDLTFQVPMQYCSLQHQTLLPSAVTSTAWYCFCFGSIISSFFLELFLHWSPVAQEMATVNIDILGISRLKWTGMGAFNSDDHNIYYCGQESLRRNRVAIIVNKRVRNAILWCNFKNNGMISVHFQGKQFNIMVIQVYALTSNAEEAEVEWFYEDLHDLTNLELELTIRTST